MKKIKTSRLYLVSDITKGINFHVPISKLRGHMKKKIFLNIGGTVIDEYMIA